MIQVASVMTVWTKLQPEYAANMWKEALNKRLGTKVCLDLFAVILWSVFQYLIFIIMFFFMFIIFGLMHNLIPSFLHVVMADLSSLTSGKVQTNPLTSLSVHFRV